MESSRTAWVLCLSVLLVLGGVGLVGRLTAPEPLRADPSDPGQIRLGRRIYVDYCASCHGTNLEGQVSWRQRRPDGTMPAPPHDTEGHTWHHPDQHLFDITKRGFSSVVPGYQSDMPGFGDRLSDADIWAVLAYIKASWPQHIRNRQANAR